MNEPPDTILVRAAEGRVVDFHTNDAPPGTLGTLRLSFGDDPIEVPNTIGNRRKMRGGDLVEVDRKLVTVDHDKAPDLAARVDTFLADADTGPTKSK